jgi:hypothetical protein
MQNKRQTTTQSRSTGGVWQAGYFYRIQARSTNGGQAKRVAATKRFVVLK